MRLNHAYGCLSVQTVIVFLIDTCVMGNGIVGMEKMKLTAEYSCIKNVLNASCLQVVFIQTMFCDGTIDCPSEDDEMICIEPNCIDQCTCLNYGIDCQHGNLNNLQSVSSMLKFFLYIRITYLLYHKLM